MAENIAVEPKVESPKEEKVVLDVKTNRGLVKVIFFSIITLGIYGLVYLSRYQKDLNAIRGVYGEKKGIGVIAMILLGIITLGIVMLVWSIKRILSTYRLAKKAGTDVKGSAVFVILSSTILSWTIVCPLLAYSKMIKTMNNLCAKFVAAPEANA